MEGGMSADTVSVFQSLLFDSLVIAFLMFGILAAAAGIGLIACREQTFRLFAHLNRHISTRQALKPASVAHDISPVVQRYRWWFAAAFIAGAAYSLYSLLSYFDTQVITAAIMSSKTPGILALSVVESLRWFMIVLSALACVIGILLGLAPGALQTIEARSDRWYSMRKITAPLEMPHQTLDKWVESHPYIAGWGITIGALIVVMSSGVILFGK
jgi:hypothetical protein